MIGDNPDYLKLAVVSLLPSVHELYDITQHIAIGADSLEYLPAETKDLFLIPAFEVGSIVADEVIAALPNSKANRYWMYEIDLPSFQFMAYEDIDPLVRLEKLICTMSGFLNLPVVPTVKDFGKTTAARAILGEDNEWFQLSPRRKEAIAND